MTLPLLISAWPGAEMMGETGGLGPTGHWSLLTLLRGQKRMWGQVSGQPVALQLDFEVVAQDKFFPLVHMVQLPELSQHHSGQFGRHHLLSVDTHDLAIDRRQQVKDAVVGELALAHHPFNSINACAGSSPQSPKEPVHGGVEGTTAPLTAWEGIRDSSWHTIPSGG